MFRGHVPRCAHNRAGSRHSHFRCFQRRRQSEVGYVDLVVISNQYVLRLEIAMHHALGMGGIERFTQLPGDLERPLKREWLFFLQQLVQVLAFDEGHSDEFHTIDLAEVVDA